MDFKLLGNVKDTKEVCPTHDIPLVQLWDKKPFCTECQRSKMEKDHQQMQDQITQGAVRRRTVEMLSKDSIIGDSTLWGCSFDNYIPNNHETQEALKNAKITAAEYSKVFNLLDIKRNEVKEVENSNGIQSLEFKKASTELMELEKATGFNTLLTGVPGVGKSHLAISILKVVNENFGVPGSCLFVSISELLMLIKDSFSNPRSKYTEANMLELLRKADLLVIDDFGSESSLQRVSNESSEFNQRFIFNVLNSRTRTIITTNLNSEQMNKIYNTKITSRLHRGVDGHIIKFTQQTKDKRQNVDY